MLRTLRSRLTYANVVATLALFVAVGTGGAYAANTVFSSDIVDGEVKSVDIGNNEIGSSDVKDNSLNTFDVHSFLGADVVDSSLTGSDIQTESLGASDIANGSLTGADIFNESLGRDEILDGSLQAKDIVQAAYNFNAAIPDVPAHQCVTAEVTGVNARSDHLLLTPDGDTTNNRLIYSARYRTSQEQMEIQACNPLAVAIDESPFARFNLLVIEDGVSGLD